LSGNHVLPDTGIKQSNADKEFKQNLIIKLIITGTGIVSSLCYLHVMYTVTVFVNHSILFKQRYGIWFGIDIVIV